jgi:endoglucanase
MTDILPFLKSLLSVSGLSGFEGPVAKLIAEKWRPLVDEISTSRVGSLHGLKRGSGKEPRPSLMIAAHMDAIGLQVSRINHGFLHMTNIGGIDIRVLPGLEVIVHASGSGEELPAVIAMPSARLLPESERKDFAALKYLVVDTGLNPREVEKRVRVGDLVSFANAPIELAGEVISGHSVDNRSSIAALTICLEELQNKSHLWDIWAVATVQEENSYLGAYSSAFQLRPQLAIVLDVTYAKSPVSDGWQTFPMGKGVGLCIGPNMHPFLHAKLKEVAERAEIPWFLDVTPGDSGTDAYATQVCAAGIPTALMEFPIRYMHTPVESVAVKDIQRAGRLLAEFIASLEENFIETIVWE